MSSKKIKPIVSKASSYHKELKVRACVVEGKNLLSNGRLRHVAVLDEDLLCVKQLAELISPNDTLQMGDPPYPSTIWQH